MKKKGYKKAKRIIKKNEKGTSSKTHHSNDQEREIYNRVKEQNNIEVVRRSSSREGEDDRMQRNREWRERREAERRLEEGLIEEVEESEEDDSEEEEDSDWEEWIQEMRLEFVCPGCGREMAPPVEIWQCKDGHAICDQCCNVIFEEDEERIDDVRKHVAEVHVDCQEEREICEHVIHTTDTLEKKGDGEDAGNGVETESSDDEENKTENNQKCVICGSPMGGRNLTLQRLANIFFSGIINE